MTPSGIGKSVTITYCHSNSVTLRVLNDSGITKTVTVANCHSNRCQYNRRPLYQDSVRPPCTFTISRTLICSDSDLLGKPAQCTPWLSSYTLFRAALLCKVSNGVRKRTERQKEGVWGWDRLVFKGESFWTDMFFYS